MFHAATIAIRNIQPEPEPSYESEKGGPDQMKEKAKTAGLEQQVLDVCLTYLWYVIRHHCCRMTSLTERYDA
jgi:hypothetical protein